VLTGIAAWTDTRTAKIPNRLNLVILGLGLLANTIRGGWLGALEKPVWQFGDGPVLGALDGLLFALLGFLVAFAVMFLMWIFGLCGGGDVKLLAAIGAWTGFALTLLQIWLASVVVLFVWFVARILAQAFSPRRLNKSLGQIKAAEKTSGGRALQKLRVTYSFPLAVATAIVLLWVFRFELQLMALKPQPQPAGAAHARPVPTFG
jgi:prepilin peptidase CpaA